MLVGLEPVGEPKIFPAKAPAPAPISVLPIGLFKMLVIGLLLEVEGFLTVLVGDVVLLVIGATAGLVVVLVTGLTGALVVVLVIGLTAGVFADTGVKPVDFTAGDAGRIDVAVLGATVGLLTLVMGETVFLAGVNVEATA